MANTENISVFVRVRPLNDSEKEKGNAWKVEGNSILQRDVATNDMPPYMLDNVFQGSCSTEQVYQSTAHALIKQVIEGFNSTVFAYGQTSSGKTHTMRGTDDDPGIIPRAVKEIFDLINSIQDREFLIRVSYMEIYNEDINDLLAPENVKLQVHETREGGVHVAGLREDIVSSPEQVLQLLTLGEQHRHVGETKMNKASSRSHTLFRMVVESRSTSLAVADGTDVGAIRVSALTLVDLAGSERISKTGAEGQRKKEGAAINKSLLTLGTVINKLSEGVAAAGGHIPYRDSKLTRILQPSLGGNAKTAIICAVTPAAQHVEESHSTLRFACRAKRVVNNATVNEVLSDAAVLKRQANEIEELRRILAASGNTRIDDEINRLRAELLRKDQDKNMALTELAAEKEEREKAQRKIDTMTRLMLRDSGDGMMMPKPRGPRKENRRETWCVPGNAEARKRPLQHPDGGSGGDDMENINKNQGSSMQRRSDGGALLTWKDALSMSPPTKIRRSDATMAFDEAEEAAAMPLSDDVGTLQSCVRELQTANVLMQRELKAVSQTAQRAQQQLRDAESELTALGNEKDKMGPALKEAQWKARQMEREKAETAAERDAAIDAAKELETVLEELRARHAENGDEVQHRLAESQAEASALKLQLEHVQGTKLALEEAIAEKERAESKLTKAKAAAADAESKAKAHATEAAEALKSTKLAEERAEEAEARSRELYEETQRLTAHISDLESRKRAPLYQKRQEEELRSVKEKATEADVRATEAELKAKEACAARDDAEARVQSLSEEIEKVRQASAEELADCKEAMDLALQRAAAEAELASTRHAEALAAAMAKEDVALAAKAAAEALLEEKDGEIAALKEQSTEAHETLVTLRALVEETQACADAAAEHVRFLEEKQESEMAVVEEEKKALETARDELHARVEAVELEKEAMSQVVAALETAKSELETKLASVAGTINAAEELKELRRKYKEETSRLNQALKAAATGTKGTEKAADRAAKETERMRNQIKDLEVKLRAAVAEKSSAQLEKAAVERELRTAKSQVEKLGKNVSRMANIEERKRDTIMTDYNQAKDKLIAAEEALSKAQADVQQCQYELEAGKSEMETLTAELEQARAVGDDALCRVEELEFQLRDAETDAESLRNELDDVRAELSDSRDVVARFTEKAESLQTYVDELEDAKALLSHEKISFEEQLTRVNAELEDAKALLSHEKASFEEQLTRVNAELEDAKTLLSHEKIAFEEQLTRVNAEHAAVSESMKESQSKLIAEMDTLQEQHRQLTEEIKERNVYISSLESQINDAMAEGMEAKATADGASAQCLRLEKQLEGVHGELAEAKADVEQKSSELQVLQQQVSQMNASLEENRSAFEKMKEELNEKMKEELKCMEERASAAESMANELNEKMKEELKGMEERASAAESMANELNEKMSAVQQQLEAALAKEEATRVEFERDLTEARESAEKWKSLVEKMQIDQAEAKNMLESSFKSSLCDMEKVVEDSKQGLVQKQAEIDRLSAALEHAEHDAEVAKNELIAHHAVHQTEFETEIARLNSQICELDTQLQHAAAEATALRQKAEDASAAIAAPTIAEDDNDALSSRCASLEQELRKSKRREEKLQALQYRLRDDLTKAGGNPAFFDQLRDVRSMEYEMDRALNKAAKEKAMLQQSLKDLQHRIQGQGVAKTAIPATAAIAFADKENMRH